MHLYNIYTYLYILYYTYIILLLDILYTFRSYNIYINLLYIYIYNIHLLLYNPLILLLIKQYTKLFNYAFAFQQDLPLHVQELLIRMKKRKPIAPFPTNLKNFVRTLHFHSPAAYELVRQFP